MKSIIVFATRYGSTEKAARMLAEKLPGQVDLININKEEPPFLNEYDNIIIGGSIYGGNIQQKIKEFCSQNSQLLCQKKTGVFICCALEEKALEQLDEAFSEVEDCISVKGYFGYEMIFSRMNFLHRLAVRIVSKIKEDRSEIFEDNIERFAREMTQRAQ